MARYVAPVVVDLSAIPVSNVQGLWDVNVRELHAVGIDTFKGLVDAMLREKGDLTRLQDINGQSPIDRLENDFITDCAVNDPRFPEEHRGKFRVSGVAPVQQAPAATQTTEPEEQEDTVIAGFRRTMRRFWPF